MATLGINRAWVARVDKNFNVITGAEGILGDATDKAGVFEINVDTSKGIASAAFSNLVGTMTDLWASNKLVYKSAGKGAAQTVLTVSSLPAEVKARILGQKKDATHNGFNLSGKSDSNNRIALLVESAEAFDIDKPVYVGLYGAIVSEASFTATSNNTADNRSQDVLTFAHVENGDKGFGNIWYSAIQGFDDKKMRDEIFSVSTTPAPAG